MQVVLMRMDKRFLGINLVILAGILWGSVSPISRVLGRLNADMVSITIIRQVIVVLFFGLWLAINRPEELFISRKKCLPMCIYSLAGPVMTNLFFVLSLVKLTVPVALVIHYTFPFITSIGSFVVTGERPCRSEWIAGVFISLGVFVIADPSSGLDLPFWGVVWGALGAIGMAIQSLLGRRVLGGGSMSSISFLFHTNLMGSLWLLGGRWLFMGAPFAHLSTTMILYGVFMGIVGGCFAYGIYFEGLRYISAPMASLGATVEMVSAMFLAALMIGEIPSFRELLGASIVFGAILLAALGNRTKK